MKIRRYTNVMPDVGVIAFNEKRKYVQYEWLDLIGQRGTKTIDVNDLVVSDPDYMLSILRLSGAENNKDVLECYFSYIDLKYPAYSYT